MSAPRRRGSGARLLALVALGSGAACSEPAGSGGAPAPPAAPFELRAVVGPALAALEAELAAPAEAEPAVPAEAGELRERVAGLAALIGGGDDPSLRALALDEAAGLGDAAVGPLLEHLETAAGSAEAAPLPPDAERAAVLEMLARIDTPRSVLALLGVLEAGAPPWVRTHAAWRLSSTSHDFAVPRLLLRLKYETDHDCVIWIASALAHFHNYSGLGVLGTVARTSTSEELRASALARTAEIAAGAGFADAEQLWQAWRGGDPERRLPAWTPSARYRLEVWRLVASLGDYQLRGVDDARYVLEALDAHAAEILAQALHDASVYVRVHAAQSLQRMGPRAAVAGPELVAGLADRELAPHAASALGASAYAPGEGELLRRLAPETDPELFLAAARALGGFPGGAPQAEQALGALYADAAQPEEVRQAAAESLLGRDAATPELVLALCDWLVAEGVDAATSERALRAWLARRAAAGNARAAEVLEAWDGAAGPAQEIPTAEARSALLATRARLVREALPEL